MTELALFTKVDRSKKTNFSTSKVTRSYTLEVKIIKTEEINTREELVQGIYNNSTKSSKANQLETRNAMNLISDAQMSSLYS